MPTITGKPTSSCDVTITNEWYLVMTIESLKVFFKAFSSTSHIEVWKIRNISTNNQHYNFNCFISSNQQKHFFCVWIFLDILANKLFVHMYYYSPYGVRILALCILTWDTVDRRKKAGNELKYFFCAQCGLRRDS